MALNYVIKHNYCNNCAQVKFIVANHHLNIRTDDGIIYKSLNNKFTAEKHNKYGINFRMYYVYAMMQYCLILSARTKRLNNKINNLITNLIVKVSNYEPN